MSSLSASIDRLVLQSNRLFNIYSLLLSLFIVVIVLEYSTPTHYVFGYLYSGAILLAYRLKRWSVLLITLAAAALTLLNMVIPTAEQVDAATIANRSIAVLALLVTGWLSDRIRRYEEAIAEQRAKLHAQEQLAQIREDFISTLTHDLKTPLLGAIATLKSFQNEQFGGTTPMQQKVLNMMERSHDSTLQLVQTMLDIYRNDTEGLSLHCQPIDLATLTEEVIATLTDLAASRRVYLSLSFADSAFRQSICVYGDDLQLRRVLTNLIANGINHTPRGSKVEIVLGSTGDRQTITIADNGSGIAPTELPHLFERFYQGHSDRQAKGSGLGLYLSRQIIEAHGGTIWAKNRSPQGAVFGFALPVYLPAAA